MNRKISPSFILCLAILVAAATAFARPNIADASIPPMPSPTRLTLNFGDSYDFSDGVRGSYTGGDFYLNNSMFLANNVDQQGVLTLGDIGTIPLYCADTPTTGYTRFGVQAQVGHTYVSLAQTGEEGNYIIFRVHSMNASSVTIDYIYLEQNRVTLYERDSYDFSDGVRGSLGGGDFYLSSSFKLYANNADQMGIKSLGDIGVHSLYLVDIPASGYTRFGVETEIGHTYVSLAQRGEEGDFIVFRVHDKNSTSVTLDYIYVSTPTITMSERSSYDFSAGTLTFGTLSAGDFYVSSGNMFYANNAGQRGIKDLGNIGDIALYQVQIPSTGYTRFGVAPIIGHTYISRAQEGEEGNFIAFRVRGIDGGSITIDYAYLPPNKMTMKNSDSYDFSANEFGTYSGGDFYLSTGTKFYANNIGQRGLQDLGAIDLETYDQINISASNYTRFGADAVVGHLYVSLAQQGEEGCLVFFRVLSIDAGNVTLKYVYLTPNRITLSEKDSYDFNDNIFGSVTGGDFYLSSSMKFYANNAGQRGLIDLGDIGTLALELVDVPASGYNRFGVEPVVGHTFVSLARQGKEGTFIIFRVIGITDQNVTLDFIIKIDTNAQLTDEDTLPTSMVLHQNYPNPFNPTTTILFDVTTTCNVNITIFNTTGQLVRTLTNREYSAGTHLVIWNALDDQGAKVPSGSYYCRMTTSRFSETKKLLLLK
ncbi:T9SS C-terminal target domain-containing protein [candidate division KSB1 bacterium]|nr:T9SS type A sorting domain-containing protein [candidate division KSB1 bacterium]RQW03119.1 MAG: T9SS C-terminal target domain-containing protein [candidate division KSB1 bacterium]